MTKFIKLKKIKIGNNSLIAFSLQLQKKSFVLIRGTKGYIMCGYLDLRIADKFGDTAIKVVGVKSITEALRARAYSLSKKAKSMGLRRNQPIKEILKKIA